MSGGDLGNTSLVFHHFGLAVRRPGPAIAWCTSFGYEIGETVFDPIQNVNLILCTHASQPAVEIIYGGEGKSPVDNLVQRHATGIIYHLCYETRDLARALEKLKNDGLETICISPPNPALLFGGDKVSFYKVTGIGLIEILERSSGP